MALNSLSSKRPDPKILKKYSGWGGLGSAIYAPIVYKDLKAMLNEEEIEAIKMTLKTAYYTSPWVVDIIYKMILGLGYKPRTVLEPSAGHGVFIERMPKSIKDNVQITAVELDSVSCDILRFLFPEVEVLKMGFESFATTKKYDLIVGNPPFGQFYVKDDLNSDLSEFSIHHYFIAKCMRLLSDDGLLAMVAPRYFLDNRKKHVRDIIAKEGGALLTAYRLPDNLFEDALVTVDLIFLTKSKNKVNWINAKKISDGKKQAFINQYFLDNRKNIIGNIKFMEIYGRTEITCKRRDNLYLKFQKKIAEDIEKYRQTINVG